MPLLLLHQDPLFPLWVRALLRKRCPLRTRCLEEQQPLREAASSSGGCGLSIPKHSMYGIWGPITYIGQWKQGRCLRM